MVEEFPKYSPDKFVNRESETDKIIELIENIFVPKPSNRVVNILGERGTGKSWLLWHIQEKIRNIDKIKVYRLDLMKVEYNKAEPVLGTLDILNSFIRDLVPDRKAGTLGTTPAEMSRHSIEIIQTLLKEKVLVLLLDHVYESDWKLLGNLEDYWLGPLAVEQRTFIILAGRGRVYPWKTPELRLGAEFIDLEPFDEHYTAKQLKQISNEAAKRLSQILDLSGGNPLGNYLLGTNQDMERALGILIEATLENVPQDQRLRIREYLEALCVLRSFDEERIPKMLAAYYNDPMIERWGYSQARQVRDELVQATFANWNEEMGGFEIDKLVKRIFEYYLKMFKRNKWEALQRTALKLYEAWTTKYERTKDYWQKEVEYHNTNLPTNNGSSTSISSTTP